MGGQQAGHVLIFLQIQHERGCAGFGLLGIGARVQFVKCAEVGVLLIRAYFIQRNRQRD